MAMLDMQADRQSSFLSRHNSFRDNNLYANCNLWPSNNANQSIQNEHYYSGILSTSLNQPLASTEILKETMIRHEAIFQDQIRQLHWLYNRQRELMNEIRSNSNRHHLWLETLQSNPFLSEGSSKCSAKTCQFSSLHWLNQGYRNSSASGAKDEISKPSCFEDKTKQEVSSSIPPGSSIRVSELLGSKFKKVGRKILDLELPAVEYIDSEEEESLVAGKFSPEPAFPSHHQYRTFESVQESCAERYPGMIDLNVVVEEDGMIRTSFAMETKALVDLNGPPILEEETDPDSNIFVEHISSNNGITCSGLSEKTMSDYQVQQKHNIQKIQETEVLELRSNELCQDMAEDLQECPSIEHESGKSSSDLVETSSISIEDADVEEAVEISASKISNQAIGKLQIPSENFDLESLGSNCSTNSYARQTSACRDKSKLVVHQAGGRNNGESSLKKRKRDFIRGLVIVQALSCSNTCMAKFRRLGVAGDKSLHSKKLKFVPQIHSATDQSTFCNGDNEFISEADGVKESEKVSKDNDAVCAEKIGVLDGHLDCRSVLESGGPLPASELVAERFDNNLSGFGYLINKNLCMNEDESSPTSSRTTDVGIDGAANLENKKSSTLRKEANENQIEINTTLSGWQSEVPLEELVREAAEAIVTISAAQVQTRAENVSLKQPIRSWQIGSLHWLAKIVASVVDDPKSEFGVVLSSQLMDHQDEYLSDGVDFFEIMTLNLEEMKEEEHFYKSNFQQVEATSCASKMAGQSGKGRTRRGRQHSKDFQSEVLPSLASLSRHEVTKDLQAIGGLIEATRTRRNSGSRRLGTSEWTKMTRKRRQKHAVSTNVDNVNCRVSELQTGHSEAGAEGRSIDWGNITRRRRGMRTPVSTTRLASMDVFS